MMQTTGQFVTEDDIRTRVQIAIHIRVGYSPATFCTNFEWEYPTLVGVAIWT